MHAAYTQDKEKRPEDGWQIEESDEMMEAHPT